MKHELKDMKEYELVLCSYLYHALTSFTLRVRSPISYHFKSTIAVSEALCWPPFKNILGGTHLVTRYEKLLDWMEEQTRKVEEIRSSHSSPRNPQATSVRASAEEAKIVKSDKYPASSATVTKENEVVETTQNHQENHTESGISKPTVEEAVPIDPSVSTSQHILDQLVSEQQEILENQRKLFAKFDDFAGMEEPLPCDDSSKTSLINLTHSRRPSHA
jgi:hypothetical protein